MNSSSSNKVIFTELPGKSGNVGQILLNNPHALNALTREMCEVIRIQLLAWQDNCEIKAVIIRGAGDQAFCAGGDVKSLHACRDSPEDAMHFFRKEYAMNQVIFHFTKPYIALLDGITMGGGAGVSLHGSHQIATENFQFAMPETAIGFFPDVGAGYFLNRCPSFFGYYLGLLGVKIFARDALASMLITDYMPQAFLADFVSKICETPLGKSPRTKISKISASFKTKPGRSDLVENQQMIQRCFSQKTVQEIIQFLERAQTDWARKTLHTLMKRSPTSLKVTLAHLRNCQSLTFDEIIHVDHILSGKFMRSHDFFEGVRAVLIDKDKKPTWSPQSICQIDDTSIQCFFEGALRDV